MTNPEPPDRTPGNPEAVARAVVKWIAVESDRSFDEIASAEYARCTGGPTPAHDTVLIAELVVQGSIDPDEQIARIEEQFSEDTGELWLLVEIVDGDVLSVRADGSVD